MAPEQAAGDPDVDHRADLYAWGIVAYELLSGGHPFADRQSIQALVTAHLVDNPRPLAEVAPHVPPPVSGLVMRCLAKSREDRPSSARDIVQALDGAVTPGDGARASPVRRAPASASRVRTVVAALGALAIVAIGAIGAIAYGLRGGGSIQATRSAIRNSPGYDAYLRGKVRVSNENRQDNDAAIASLRAAISADPALGIPDGDGAVPPRSRA